MKKLIPISVGVVCIAAVLLADEPPQKEVRQQVVEVQEERLFGFEVVREAVPIQRARHEWHPRFSIMNHLFAGQRVELDRALSGGFNIIILDEGQNGRDFEDAGYEPPTILHAGANSIVVIDENGVTQTIAADAIHVVTRHPQPDKP